MTDHSYQITDSHTCPKTLCFSSPLSITTRQERKKEETNKYSSVITLSDGLHVRPNNVNTHTHTHPHTQICSIENTRRASFRIEHQKSCCCSFHFISLENRMFHVSSHSSIQCHSHRYMVAICFYKCAVLHARERVRPFFSSCHFLSNSCPN